MKKVFVLALIAVLGSLFISCGSKEKTPQETREDLIYSKFYARPPHGFHAPLVDLVSRNLNNPKSFDHLETFVIEKDSTILIKMDFTAENGFGGSVRESVTVEADFYGNILTIYDWF